MILNKGTLQALFQSFSMAFKKGLGVAPGDYEKVSMTIPSASSENVYPWLGRLPGMREWIGDRQINNLTLHDYAIRNKTFELTVGVRREDIEDDNMGIYSSMFEDLGAQASIHPNQLVFEALTNGDKNKCFDGLPFFAAGHKVDKRTYSNLCKGDDNAPAWYLLNTRRPIRPLIFQRRRPYELTRMDRPTDNNVFMRSEYLYGVDARVNVGYGLWQLAIRSTEELNAENYAKARALMASYRDEGGKPLGLVPNLLVAPPELESAVRKLLAVEFGEGGKTNEWKGSADFLITPWLESKAAQA